MNQYLAWDDCVARYGDWDIFPTEWKGFPIHHTDPFWNAALFEDEDYDDLVLGQELARAAVKRYVNFNSFAACFPSRRFAAKIMRVYLNRNPF